MKSLRTRAPLTLGISVLAVLGLAACGAQTDPGAGAGTDTSDAPWPSRRPATLRDAFTSGGGQVVFSLR